MSSLAQRFLLQISLAHQAFNYHGYGNNQWRMPRAAQQVSLSVRSFLSALLRGANDILVRRVHWLRGRAQYMRWKEEVTLVHYEMQWTVRSFVYRMTQWNDRQHGAEIVGSGGAAAYAARQAARWRMMATDANAAFKGSNSLHIAVAI